MNRSTSATSTCKWAFLLIGLFFSLSLWAQEDEENGSDARAAARATLDQISTDLKRRGRCAPDRATRDHFADLLARTGRIERGEMPGGGSVHISEASEMEPDAVQGCWLSHLTLLTDSN